MTENNLSQLVGQGLTYNWTVVSYLMNSVDHLLAAMFHYYEHNNTAFSLVHCGTLGLRGACGSPR